MSIKVTVAAAAKVHQLITEEGKPNLRLRVYIVGGGCAGFQYGFAFDAEQNPDDMLFLQDNVGIIVDVMSLQYLTGSQIDYVEGLQGAHFVVSNPNANTTCGCGSSFSVR
jgi:iron-sulfur cluster insertion protein